MTIATIAAGAIFYTLAVWDIARRNTQGNEDSRQSAERAKITGHEIARSCIGTDPVTLAVCVYDKINSEQENQRAEHDLRTQQEMAQWAFWMFVVSGFGAALTGVGIYFVRENLIEMQRQRAISQSAVDAALESNKTARDIGEATVRAYVHIDKAELYFQSEISPVPRVMLTVVNTGATPAKWFAVRGHCVLQEPEAVGIDIPAEGTRWNALGANSNLTLTVRNHESLERFAYASIESIICRGEVEYETFFGERFFSEFDFIARPNFRFKWEPPQTSMAGSPSIYDKLAGRGKEVPYPMSRLSGSMVAFEKK